MDRRGKRTILLLKYFTCFSGSTQPRRRRPSGLESPTTNACASNTCPHSHILKPSCLDLPALGFVHPHPGFSQRPCLGKEEMGRGSDQSRRGFGACRGGGSGRTIQRVYAQKLRGFAEKPLKHIVVYVGTR